MSLAIVADPEIRERARCVRILANQTPFSAVGVATWSELLEVLAAESSAALVIYAKHLPDAPDDSSSILASKGARVVMASAEVTSPENLNDATSVPHPVSEETLILVARSLNSHSTQMRMSFMPIDLIQMICMSGDSQVLVVSHAQGDAGVIEVRNGEVWTAFDALGVGADAFARLIRPEMRARISPRHGSSKPRTIFLGLHELVLDSLRRIDEGQVSSSPQLSTPRLEAALCTPEELAQKIEELNLTARQLLMQRKYDDAARVLTLLAEIDPNSALVRANLAQLHKLGYPK